MGSSVSAVPQAQGGNWPVLSHADILSHLLTRARVQSCALPLFFPISSARDGQQSSSFRILDPGTGGYAGVFSTVHVREGPQDGDRCVTT